MKDKASSVIVEVAVCEKTSKKRLTSGRQCGNITKSLRNSAVQPLARVVELVDSLASGASARKGVRVRLPPRAPRRSKRHIVCSDFFTRVRAHSFCCSSFPNHNRLRWVVIWFWVRTRNLWHLYDCGVPRRSKLCIACSDFFTKVRAHSRRCSLLIPNFCDLRGFYSLILNRWKNFFIWLSQIDLLFRQVLVIINTS